VIYYHLVGEPLADGLAGGPSAGMITPPRQLEAHIALLRRRGYRFATAGELAMEWQGPVPPPGIAVLTFDDGWRDGLTTAAPLLARHGVRATFFVCPAGFGRHAPAFGDAGVVMTEDEARQLHETGMELASHTWSHRPVKELSDGELRHEMVASRDAVEAITGEPCLTLAYPSGNHDRRVEQAAADAGYQLAFATRGESWEKFAVPRVGAPTTAPPEKLIEKLALPEDVTPVY
jgi:peptidoglycan/xylan/chitin deacetylase (PgdA/CDA1 family)